MEWKESVVQKLEWNGEISNREQKENVAKKLASLAKDGDVIGFGSGSTSYLTIYAIAEKMKKENIVVSFIDFLLTEDIAFEVLFILIIVLLIVFFA